MNVLLVLNQKTNVYFSVLIFSLILTLDQLSKIYIRSTFFVSESKAFIPDIVSITHHTNSGAAFGIFQDYPRAILALSIVFIFIICLWIRTCFVKNEQPIIVLGLVLILSGAVGNLIDRIFYGYVTDFIDFHFFPIFNVADSAVSVGATVIIFYTLYEKLTNKEL